MLSERLDSEWEDVSFGFRVEQPSNYEDPEYLEAERVFFALPYGQRHETERPRAPKTGDTWTVGLPHQCDPWVITECTPHDEAVRHLEAFIAEARDALTALRERREVIPED